MLEELNEENMCFSNRNPALRIDKLIQKIKYLEKENEDLVMDLEDVESTLLINKSMINTLMDCSMNADDKTKEIIKNIRDEVIEQNNQIKRLKEERDGLKSNNLLLEQIKADMKAKEEETNAFYEAEYLR